MDEYLTRDGQAHNFVPDPKEYIKNEKDADVAKYYRLMLFRHKWIPEKEEEKTIFVGLEDFVHKPNKMQIKWAILKHKAAYAELRKIYTLEF